MSSKRKLSLPPNKQVLGCREYRIKKENISIISCSNIVLKIQSDGFDGYLSECRMHEPIWEYVYRFIDDYFSCFCERERNALSDKTLILNSLQNPINFEKFNDIGTQSPYSDSPYHRFLHGDDASEAGLDLSSASESQKIRIRRFVERYAWPQLTAYYAHRDLQTGKYHCRTTSKVLATQAMAQLLGLESMFPHAEYKKFIVTDADDCVLFGSFMETASGVCAMDIPGHQRRKAITPDFQCAMLNMNLLDVICHEQDHSPNNYNVVLDDSRRVVGISVFDNNGIGTFSLNRGIDYETYKKCSSFIRSDGTVNRPCLDKTVAEAVLALTWKKVKKTLSLYLSKPVIWCTWNRIVALQRAIKRSIAANPDFLLDREAFSEKTIEDELSGHYGKTYLSSFLQDCLHREQYR